MASEPGECAPALPNGSWEGSKFPPKADLRKMMAQSPVPILAPGMVDMASMGGDEPARQAIAVLEAFNVALASEDVEGLGSLFCAKQAYWKDQLALTYHLRTFYTPGVIAAGLLETKNLRQLAGGFQLDTDARFIPATPDLQFIDASFNFETLSPAATCSGRLLLLPLKTDSIVEWKIWILGTKLENLGVQSEDESLLQSPQRQLHALERFETDAFIVGGGNAAVALAARLKALNVDCVMAERNPRVGDNWALRYDALRFHVPTSFCELPYMLYDKQLQTPNYLRKNDLADQVRRYVEAFNLNVITSAEIMQTRQLPDKRWCIEFHTPSGTRTVVAKHPVQATGIGSQKPYVPHIAGEQLYKGINMHSSLYKNPAQLVAQGVSSVLIIGSANTAFDVLEDCHAAGLRTTMVARSPTYVLPVEYVCDKRSLGAYDYGVALARGLCRNLASQEPERYTALAKAGFAVHDSAHPDTALMHNLIERGCGHYVDVGGTALLAEGKAAVIGGVEPVGYTETGLRFSDGSTADADAVVWCTGFADSDASTTVPDILKTSLPVDATWGIDEEGKIRGIWKRHQHVDNYWVMGGYTQQHRWHSRTVALQIKAELEGVLPPAYRETPRA
ncbi:Uu.00g067530.m01.CDS01 [Anthostomella pinea]|uniref:Uu.00g067530.m01.CDS01 n=1 Tax=Anthostomella pinea TaxID=933095 RepID=A0AAI8VVD0_9PEZI|nr:Uu.00g067530.m01.CDS01 [Anthostomella pinea]